MVELSLLSTSAVYTSLSHCSGATGGDRDSDRETSTPDGSAGQWTRLGPSGKEAAERGGRRSSEELAGEYKHSNRSVAGSDDPSLRIRRTRSGKATACWIWTDGNTVSALLPVSCALASEEMAFRVADGHAVLSTGRNDAASERRTSAPRVEKKQTKRIQHA